MGGDNSEGVWSNDGVLLGFQGRMALSHFLPGVSVKEHRRINQTWLLWRRCAYTANCRVAGVVSAAFGRSL